MTNPKIPKTYEEAWRNYRRNRGWFILRGKQLPKVYQLTEKEFRQKYGAKYKKKDGE